MKINVRKYLGVFLLFLGALILIQNLNLFKSDIGSIIGASIYGAISVYLFFQYSKDTTQWWWLITGVFLLGIGMSNIFVLFDTLGQYSPILGVSFAGAGFLLVYLLDRTNWWALIPGSIFISLGVIRYLEVVSPDTSTNGILFLGMGLAFLLLFVLPSSQGRMNWPLIPSVILFAIGATASLNQDLNILSFVGPGLLILGGLLVLIVARTNKF
jgi:hypothetical protein